MTRPMVRLLASGRLASNSDITGRTIKRPKNLKIRMLRRGKSWKNISSL